MEWLQVLSHKIESNSSGSPVLIADMQHARTTLYATPGVMTLEEIARFQCIGQQGLPRRPISVDSVLGMTAARFLPVRESEKSSAV